VTEPQRRPDDVLARGDDEQPVRRWPALSPLVRRTASALLVVAVAVAVLASVRTSAPPDPAADGPVPDRRTSADLGAAARSDVQLALSAAAQRDRLIRDVPASFRDAAGLASAMRDGRTPGNFFLALAYVRTLYGTVVVGTPGEPFVNRGPVQWDPAEFRRYADSAHRDVSSLLDSFLAVDAALHRHDTVDFSDGAYLPARTLGLSRAEARSIAQVYEVLDGAGVRDGLPN
jgi:hypothetical protein